MGRNDKGRSSYQRQFGGGGKQHSQIADSKEVEIDRAALAAAQRRIHQQKSEEIDKVFGYEQFEFRNSNDANNDSNESKERRGWLFNMAPTTVNNLHCVVCDDMESSSDFFSLSKNRKLFRKGMLEVIQAAAQNVLASICFSGHPQDNDSSRPSFTVPTFTYFPTLMTI